MDNVNSSREHHAEAHRYTGRPSPYYKESHRKLRDYVRAWCDEVRQKTREAFHPANYTANGKPNLLKQHDLTAPEHRPLHRRLGSIRRRRPFHLHQMCRCRPPSTDCLWQNHPVRVLAIPHRSRHQAAGLGRVPRLHPVGRTNPRRPHRLNLHRTRGWRATVAEIRVSRAGGQDLSRDFERGEENLSRGDGTRCRF